MEFIFETSKYDGVSFKPQVSKALEKRTELNSRKKYSKMWKFTDKMNSNEEASKEVLEKRRSRQKVYGIFLILLGLFALIPSLMEPKELLLLLVLSVLNICIGIFNIRYGVKSKKVRSTSFDKAALKLFSEYENIPRAKVIFNSEKIESVDSFTISYSEIEEIFITEDLFILIWNERITVLQKKDLLTYNVEEFISLITDKSQDLFDVVNVV